MPLYHVCLTKGGLQMGAYHTLEEAKAAAHAIARVRRHCAYVYHSGAIVARVNGKGGRG